MKPIYGNLTSTYEGNNYESYFKVDCPDIVGNSARIVMFTTHETVIDGISLAEYGVIETQGLK